MRIARLVSFGAALVAAGFLLMVQRERAAHSKQADAAKEPPPSRDKVSQDLQNGNFADAYTGFSRLALDPNDDPLQVGSDLKTASQCLWNLGRLDELDAFREEVIKLHAANWRLLKAAAESYLEIDHHGFMVSGSFERGNKRGGGQWVNAASRDRHRALQLLVQAMPLVEKEPDHAAAGDFYFSLATALLGQNGFGEAWRLQALTDLATPPDYEEGWYYGPGQAGAPVNPDGTPVFHKVADRFETAASDGERWRWALRQAAEMSPARLNDARWQWGQFLLSQFGEQTMAEYGFWFDRQTQANADGKKNESGTYALHTLADSETIAKLATGIRRFDLPEEFNYISVFRQIAADPATGYGDHASDQLASIYENRRQYATAAEHWQKAIAAYGPGQFEERKRRLEQIVNPWGRFEGASVQPAGKGASVELRFRNCDQVHFEARSIRVSKLLDDVKKYLKSNPGQLDWNQLNIQDIGNRLLQEGQDAYLEPKPAATWDLQLTPRENHFDERVTVPTPLQKAGGYFVTAQVQGGVPCHIVLWLSDTVIVKKAVEGKTFCFVADAVTGKPIPKANLEFFGYRQDYVQNTNRFNIRTTQFAEFTDNDGQLLGNPVKETENFQWLITARTKQGRFAHLGFTNVWRAQRYDQDYEAVKVFTITDRPVYRPKQKVKYKFWVRHAKYDQEDESTFAERSFKLELTDPQGVKVLEKTQTADAFGGFEGEYELPAEAPLGVYQIYIVDNQVAGGGSFRVEEYKKPEFEVLVQAPTEPVALGEKIQATVEAKYYFGAPVTSAKVKYKVLRSSYRQDWYPIANWDWFYGRGYWWFAYDAPWYPGWAKWGCSRPFPWWWGGGSPPPEVISEAEVPIGADGKIKIEIDTALAKEIHGDQDHSYSITAEVIDESRRAIVGTGEVKVARAPFKVFSWVDKGHYRVGDTITAHFQAHTLNQKPIEGKGNLKLFRITYDEKRQPIETLVNEWELPTDSQGSASQEAQASEAGQYRWSYVLADSQGHAIEGGYLFTVMGDGVAGDDFRFTALELIPDRREYAPGEKVRLQINTDRSGGTVLLFARPTNGVYLPPKIMKLKGRSATEELEVVKKDMPNFFVEAVTVSDGVVHTEARELVVPPEKRVLNVKLEPSSENYKPGEAAEVKVTLTDFTGKPFVGSTVVAIYDKAVEYVSGGSNVPEIKEFFWKWRRNHYPATESNLGAYFYNLVRQGELAMSDLGVFGGSVVEETLRATGRMDGADKQANTLGLRTRAYGGMGGGGLGAPGAVPESAALGDAAGAPMAAKSATGDAGFQQGAQGAPAVQPTVRANFADTAFWAGSLATDADGVATIKLDMPENLTTWKVRCWGLGHGTKVGEGTVEVITRKDLILRMQAPRFFTQKDEVTLSANVHNYLKTKKSVQVVLELEGNTLSLLSAADREQTVEIEPNQEARVDWRVKVDQEGEAIVRMKALTDEESDAMENRFPVKVHGMLKMDSVAGVVRPDEASGKFTLRVPEERRVEQSRLEVRYSPTLAGAMVDALPYLVDYPYGCTEQTLNRFLPTVITQKILLEMRLDLKTIQEKRTNLNAQEIGDDRERAKGWKRFDRNPVFDEAEVRDMVKEGTRQLTDMQLADGGWGWFSGWGEHSYPHTTAYVVHGLQIAQRNDVALTPGMLERGVAWLRNYQATQIQWLKNAPSKTNPYKTQADALDAFVFMTLVDAGEQNAEMLEFLYRDRVSLPVYAKAMYGLALEKLKQADKLAMLLRNIQQFLVQDDENQTAYLKLPEDNYWWYWYGSEIEAQAYYLKLLARTDPKGKTASRLVKYLLNNRKHATYWNSTRDTSVAIEALGEFLTASGENKPEMVVEVWFDGQKKKEVRIDSANLFDFDNRFLVEGADLAAGEHEVEFKRMGKGPLYFNGYVTNFTLEDDIKRAGLELKVNRKFFKLVKVDKKSLVAGERGQAVDQKVEKYRREELADLSTLKSSDLVEIELTIESKNDYEYLLFEDMKAAGFEPVDLRSGYQSNSLGAYMELRDDRVCFFARALARGKHSVAYRMRAEIPGKFSALPTRASAMYAPELKGNSDELKLKIED